MAEQGRIKDWQNIIWREWRYTDDNLYAQHLFELVANQPAGLLAILLPFSLISLYGILSGLLLGQLIYLVARLYASELLERLAVITWFWGILGGVSAGAIWLLLQNGQPSWHTWLKQLTPNTAVKQLKGRIDWLGERVIFSLILGLGAGVLGLILEPVIHQGTLSLIGLIGLVVGILGLGVVFGLSIGQRDGLIIGFGGWMGGWLTIGIGLWWAGWQGVGLVGLSLAIVGVLKNLFELMIVGGIIGLGLRLGSDNLLDGALDMVPKVKTSHILNLALIGILAMVLLVLSNITQEQSRAWWIIKMIALQGWGGIGGVISWLGAGVGVGLGILFGAANSNSVDEQIYQYRPYYFWWSPRPYAHFVQLALKQACQNHVSAQFHWPTIITSLEQSQQKPEPVNVLIAQLHDKGWIQRLIAAHTLAVIGGEAVRPLLTMALNHRSSLCPTSIWLLDSIEQDTTTRLAPQAGRLICPACLVRCGRVSIAWSKGNIFSYYGCRVCGQSQEFFDLCS